jgi:hypothetical protein
VSVYSTCFFKKVSVVFPDCRQEDCFESITQENRKCRRNLTLKIKPEYLEKVRVGSLISVVANTGLGVVF